MACSLLAGTIEGIPVWRPFLEFHKDTIYDFAHRYGVPYFRDTTPLWCTRGKLRNQLIPLLKDMFGEGVLGNLSSVATSSYQMGTCTTNCSNVVANCSFVANASFILF